jgi:hypothetical protein
LKLFVYCFCLFTLLKDDLQILVYHEKNHQKEAKYTRKNTFFKNLLYIDKKYVLLASLIKYSLKTGIELDHPHNEEVTIALFTCNSIVQL